MSRFFRFSRFSLVAGLVVAAMPVARAQQQALPSTPPQVAPQQDWAPLGIESLGQGATTREDFTLNRQMLQFAEKFLDSSDEETRRVVAGLNAVTVHSYHFREAGDYDPSAVAAIREQYRAAGWKHMVSSHGVQERAGVTDLWVHFDHAQITNLAVLLEGPRDLDFVAFSGMVRPLDLLHLSGHFGIPRFDSGAFVPAPDSRP